MAVEVLFVVGEMGGVYRVVSRRFSQLYATLFNYLTFEIPFSES